MAEYRAYNKYLEDKIKQATKEQLTLMLFDGAIKFCNMAITAVENKHIEKANYNIRKVENIILEFRATLNFDYNIAKELDNIYEYLYNRLVQANIKKDKEILEEVLGHLRGLRDTWAEAMVIAKKENRKTV